MPHGHPVVSGEFMHGPIAAKSANTAVLFASERPGWRVIHAVVVDVGHPGLQPHQILHDRGMWLPTIFAVLLKVQCDGRRLAHCSGSRCHRECAALLLLAGGAAATAGQSRERTRANEQQRHCEHPHPALPLAHCEKRQQQEAERKRCATLEKTSVVVLRFRHSRRLDGHGHGLRAAVGRDG